MLTVIIIFLLAAIYFYCLLGGADFGAGIVELTTPQREKNMVRKTVSNAMAPIWEANHMWLIISVVILFNAFPEIYSRISIALYIPLILLLVGIVLRGTAFTFRYYDTFKDASQEVYSKVFEFSSLMVTFFFGLILGALVSNKIMINPAGFVDGYITTWLNLFSITVGIFVCTMFAFTASVYLINETTDEKLQSYFTSRAIIFIVSTVISGGLVFLASIIENVSFTKRFFSNPISIASIILATLSLPLLYRMLKKGFKLASKVTVGAQILLIIGAFYAVYFPNIVVIKDGSNLTLINSAAPNVTLTYLGWALIVGSFVIFPMLFYMLKVFKFEKEKTT